MLLDVNPVSRCHVIAGERSGKPVYIPPQAKPIYDELYKLAKRNNYWAQVTVKGIQHLAAGRLHMNNIFVHPGGARRDGKEEFVVVLPGCKVTAEKLDGDGYKLLHFAPDAHYFELLSEDAKPGLYRAENGNAGWDSRPVKNGVIEKRDDYVVVVSDSGYERQSRALEMAANSAKSTPFFSGKQIERIGFDYHFTPGDKQIGGLRNLRKALRPLDMEELNGSALLLANSMASASKQKGIVWVSERGGSAVLSQALKILSTQGIQLKDHHLFMLEPKTSTKQAVESAMKLGMSLERDVTKVGFLNVVGNSGQLGVIRSRYKNDDDYNLLMAGVDFVKQGLTIQGGLAAVATLLAAGGATMSAPAVPAIISFIAAVTGGTVGGVAAASTVTEQVAPRLHHKIKAHL
ncbi:hypothetical protein [Simiduia agarivorans]|uniref:Uncharacterized protein n=1 Tax=Simiduia agarivorans (strain DSM 21679 / JCM 13881 / BCRC 17597 / SA1) TaxID=1117647 RepID=K4KHD3_SIMAS|nr:hypothetical protein [Simiduia agarivorans]AFU98519.1 hypothetical protein M5M_06620 [Simiduia agarivorans SA1 = DSM 21679]